MNKNKEQEQMIAAENRERNFVKAQSLVDGAMRPDTFYNENQESSSDLIKWQQDLDDDVELLRHDLLREVFVDGKWMKARAVIGWDVNGQPIWGVAKPIVNNMGCYKVISVVKRYLNRNFMMSNLKEENIMRMLRRLNEDLICNIYPSYKEYSIDVNDLSILRRMVMDSVEATLFRAYNNGERNYIKMQNKRVEAFSDSMNNQQISKKGIMKVFD